MFLFSFHVNIHENQARTNYYILSTFVQRVVSASTTQTLYFSLQTLYCFFLSFFLFSFFSLLFHFCSNICTRVSYVGLGHKRNRLKTLTQFAFRHFPEI